MVVLAREIIRYDDVLLYEGGGGTPDRTLLDETGFGYPPRYNMIDQIGDPYINVYRRSTSSTRVFAITLSLGADSPQALKTLIRDWENTHKTGSERVLKRVTDTGGVYYLDCVPKAPLWTKRTLMGVEVTQGYEAANPWWYGDAVEYVSAFNAGVPVPIAVVNGGNIPSWVVAAIVGAVTEPKITVSTGYFLELDYTNGAGETIDIDCQPPAQIEHSVDGNIFGYRTSDSWINRVQVPEGSTDVTIVATAGVATCTLQVRPRYGAKA